MAHAFGCSREELLLDCPDAPVPLAFADLVARRLAHEPVAYIVGRRAFWTIELEVGPGVLIPRADSETLIEAALALFGDAGPATILDLGTGPGTLLLAALDIWPDARGLGIDSSAEALAFANRNAARLGLSDRAGFRLGDWDEGLDERFDLILANPPYVARGEVLPLEVSRWEPAQALFSDDEGYGALRAIATLLPRRLSPGGVACIEIGAGQLAQARTLFSPIAAELTWRTDLAGIPRCLIVRC